MSESNILANFGERVRHYRAALGISQEELGFRSDLDRTYISDIERGKRNVGLINITQIARALQITPALLVAGEQSTAVVAEVPTYEVRERFEIDCGFQVSGEMVKVAAVQTAEELQALPFSLFRSIDLKAVSGIVGALFATHIARQSGAIVNPIEKGHPDVIPTDGEKATEAELRNFGRGLEIKCTVGNVNKGSELGSGERRLDHLSSITWQAHHRQVESLMGLVVDFAGKDTSAGYYPIITAAFFADDLEIEDWGEISGTTGRNTKVTGMRASGKQKMGSGWILLLEDEVMKMRYSTILGFRIV